MNYSTVICTTSSEDMLLISKKIEPKKKELLKKYEKEIANGDAFAMQKIENELLDYCQNELKDDPAFDNIRAGAGADLGNNFKNMYVMKGAVRLTDGSYDVVESSYISGLDKKDFVKTNDSAVGGPYSRAVNTKDYGYIEKLFVSAYQDIKILKSG